MMKPKNRYIQQAIRRYLLLLACLCAVTSVRADSIADLLRAFGNGTGSQYQQQAHQLLDLLSKEGITDETLKRGSDIHPDTIRQQVWYWSAEYFYDRQQYEDAVEYAQKALPLCHVGNDREIEGACLNLLAISNIRLGFYQQAAKYAKLCNKLDVESGNHDNISSSLNTLAGIYLAARQPATAEKYVLRGIDECKKSGNQQRMAILLGMACEVYNAKEDYCKGLAYADKALGVEQTLGNAGKMAIRQSQKAASLIGLGRFAEAQALLIKVIPIFRGNGNRQSLAISCNQMGRLLLKGGKEADAARYYQEAANLFTSLDDPYGESHARLGLYYSLKKTAPQQAMENIDRYNLLKDSLYSASTSEQLARFHEEFSVDELQTQKESVRRNSYLILAGSLLLIMLLVAVAWWLLHRQNLRNASRYEALANNLDQIREEHRKLQGYYSNAITASRPDSNELSAHDKQFLEHTAIVINDQLKGGSPNLETISAELGMSSKQFSRRLKSLTGDTPKEYLLQMRMLKARHLLDQHPEMAIGEVAYQCGYEEKANFTRAFKRYFGVAPSVYIAKSGIHETAGGMQQSVDEKDKL